MMLLDTCALLWIAVGGGKISPGTCQKIQECPVIYISAITGFEIAIKFQKKKLELPALPDEWLDNIISHHDIYVLPVDIHVSVRSAMLPTIHTDPCDRMIIATAEIHQLTVVTSDPVFESYGVKVVN